MTRPFSGLIFLLVLILQIPAAAQSAPFLPLEQVERGMKGVGRTIFDGVEIEEFGVEILGVLRNVRPRQNLILARLSGEKIEQSGVFGGMSGSPVYVDGRLVGAVAYSWAFATEPIAGITPIEEIVGAFKEGLPRLGSNRPAPFQPDRLYSVSTLSDLVDPIRRPSLAVELEPGRFGDLQRLTPIASPLSLSGVTPATLRYFTSLFRSLGLEPVTALSATGLSDLGEAKLEPGATLAAQLVRGDLDLSASGTITHISGTHVYAFGHPFMSIGSTDMPMTKGGVVAIISSLAGSQKVSAVGEPIGSITQDRATGILGLTGRQPDLIPLKVKLLTSRGEEKEFNYEVVTDGLLSPLLTTLSVFNSLTSYERVVGNQTLQMRCTISLKDQPEVRFENSVSDLANSSALTAVAAGAPVNVLLNSGFDDLEMEQVVVEITAVEQAKTAVLDRVWVDRVDVEPGEEIELSVFLRKPNGDMLSEKFPLKIPEQLPPGPLSILVGEGTAVTKVDAEIEASNFVPETSGQLIRAINNLKKNNRLYIRLFRNRPGAIVGGEGLPELPPSMLELLGSGRTSGGYKPIGKVIYVEHELPATDFVLEGHQVVRINVKG